MSDQRYSDNDVCNRDIPSFIEPLPPLIKNPFMRPRPQKGVKLFEESVNEEPELVQVYLRLKPCRTPINLYEIRSDRCLITSLDTTTAGHGRRTQHNVSKMYTFSKIFPPECNQKEVFEVVVKDNLKKLPEGQNFTLLTYGPSGSGKTFTLMGTVSSPGLIPRSLEYVFGLVDAAQQPIYKPAENGADKLSCVEQEFELQLVKRLRLISTAPLRDRYRRMSAQLQNTTTNSLNQTNKTKFYVWVSFVEIYNEAIYDLLAPPEKRNKLRIREDALGNVYVKGAVQTFVKSGEEAFDVMVAGKRNLVVAATGVHAHSSRSHCIFTITMLAETDGEIRSSCVRLCDLAGCERARATRNTGTRMQESRSINSSLHVLEKCLHMLRRNQGQRQEGIVPYRESKLTRLLGSGLSGGRGEAVSMVVTLNPSPEYAHETKHVLALAAVAQDIQINNTIPSTNSLETLNSIEDTTLESSSEVLTLRTENERLHFELMQAQNHIRDLLWSMEEKQRQTADLMNELVEDAKSMTKQYYESQLEALRTEMEDLKEEYEEKLEDASARLKSISISSSNHDKVEKLRTKIAILQEELTSERLARARAEEEVQRLRICIEERDENAFKERTTNENVVMISDDDYESETDDPLNESLEPVFRKKTITKSNILNNMKTANKQSSNEDDSDSSDDDKTSKSCVNRETCNNRNTSFSIHKNINFELAPRPKNDDSVIIKSINKEKQSLTADNITRFYGVEEQLADILPDSNETLIKSIRNTYHSMTSDNLSQLTFNDENDTKMVSNTNIASNINETLLIKSVQDAKYSITADDFSQLTFNDDEKPNDTRPNSFHDKESTKASNKDNIVLIKSIGDVTYNTTTGEFSELTFNGDEQLTHSNSNNRESIVWNKSMEVEKDNGKKHIDSKMTSDLKTSLPTTSPITNGSDYPYNESNYLRTIKFELSRGTHLVRNSNNSSPKPDEGLIDPLNLIGANLVKDTGIHSSKCEAITNETDNKSRLETKIIIDNNIKTIIENESKEDKVLKGDSPFKKPSESMIVSKITKNMKMKLGRDSSLRQFEQVEIATKEVKCPDNKMGLCDIKIRKDKRYFFDCDKEFPNADEDSETDKFKPNINNELPNAGSTIPDINTFKSCLKLDEEETPVNAKLNEDALKLNIMDGANIITQEKNTLNDVKLGEKRSFADVERLPSIIKEKADNDFNPGSIKKLLGDNLTESKLFSKCKQDSIDIFESFSPCSKNMIDIESTGKLVEKQVFDSNIGAINKGLYKGDDVIKEIREKTNPIADKVSIIISNNEISHVNDTINAFEDIYKNLSESRVTDFDLLVTDTSSNQGKISVGNKNLKVQENNVKFSLKSLREEINTLTSFDIKKSQLSNEMNNDEHVTENSDSTTTKNMKTEDELVESNADIILETNTQVPKSIESQNEVKGQDEYSTKETKYNLRRKPDAKLKTDQFFANDNGTVNFCSESTREILKEDTLLKSVPNSDRPKKNLRLRRRKNQHNEDMDVKLKDMVNLQTEFSDVTLDKPTARKKVKDIPSPETESENLPPLQDVQSCPSKSVTRSRRKLFTPRVEPLEESLGQSEGSNERVSVPRPSYHRPRARRKL